MLGLPGISCPFAVRKFLKSVRRLPIVLGNQICRCRFIRLRFDKRAFRQPNLDQPASMNFGDRSSIFSATARTRVIAILLGALIPLFAGVVCEAIAAGRGEIELRAKDLKLALKYADMSLEELMEVEIRPTKTDRKSRRPRKSRPPSHRQSEFLPSFHSPATDNRLMIA